MSLHTKKEFRALCGGMSVQYMSIYVKRGAIVLRKDDFLDDSNPKNQKVLRKFQLKNGGAISLADLESFDFMIREKSTSKPAPKEKDYPIEKEKKVVDVKAKVLAKKKPNVKNKKSKVVNKKVVEVEVKPSIEKPLEIVKPIVAKEQLQKAEKKRYIAKTKEEITDRVITPAFLASSEENLEAQKKRLEVLRLQKEVELKDIEIKKKMGQVIPVGLVEGVFSRHSNSFVKSFNNTLNIIVDEFSHKYSVSREDRAKFRGTMIENINIAITEAINITNLEIDSIVNDYKEIKK